MFNDLQFTLYFSDHPTETKADIGKTMAIVYSNGGRYMKLKSNMPYQFIYGRLNGIALYTKYCVSIIFYILP